MRKLLLSSGLILRPMLFIGMVYNAEFAKGSFDFLLQSLLAIRNNQESRAASPVYLNSISHNSLCALIFLFREDSPCVGERKLRKARRNGKRNALQPSL